MIEANDLTKYYGSFQVKKSEIVGFLGPNGADKTTTMRILTGFMPPSGGAARVAEFDMQSESFEVRHGGPLRVDRPRISFPVKGAFSRKHQKVRW